MRIKFTLVVLAITAGALLCGCTAQHPAAVRIALEKAGSNRGELERVLAHYQQSGDQQKLRAAEFLIGNMPGQGYAVLVFYDKQKQEVPFEALDYPDFKAASAAFDKLEKEHGPLDYGKKRLDADLDTITADYLIENIDAAFAAWRELPWGESIEFETFCEYILPYRGSEEPLNRWRNPCRERLVATIAKLRADGVIDPFVAGEAIRKAADDWIRFNEIFYLHPTDQGYDEMCKSKLGRCEDMTNMYLYATRSAAALCTSDYTPFWADRDNNHAWEVILHADGTGATKLSNRAAKIYRKMFSRQPTALGSIKREDEQAPRWLARSTYRDVTDQYTPVADATIALPEAPPAGQRFAYACVFNGGQWQPVHWGWIEAGDSGGAGRVTFTKLGRNIAYLPGYWVSDELRAAGPPFILTSDGRVRVLAPDASAPVSVDIAVTTPDTPDADTKRTKDSIKLEAGKEYELFVWRDGGWQSLGKRTAGAAPIVFNQMPGGGLFWLVATESNRLERIFTVENGKPVWW